MPEGATTGIFRAGLRSPQPGGPISASRTDNPLRDGETLDTVYDFTDSQSVTTTMPLTAFDDPEFLFTLQVLVPGLRPIGRTIRCGRDGLFIVAATDASWIEIIPGEGAGGGTTATVEFGGPRLLWPAVLDAWRRGTTATVEFGGPRPLWPAVLDAWRRWERWGRPQRDRFGLTVHDSGRQQIWLDAKEYVVAATDTESGSH